MEVIFEFILEVIFGVAFDDTRIKTWIKTGLFILLFGALTALFTFMSVSAYQKGNADGCVITAIMAAVLGIGGMIGAIYGHKRDWI